MKHSYTAAARRKTWLWMGLLVGSTVAATSWLSTDLIHARTLGEGRAVADMVESIGRWASQYGGVHVRTEGVGSKMPGTFLTRSIYASREGDEGVLQGAKLSDARQEREALARAEAYYWKNPALIQREVADAVQASGNRVVYRLTARSVLNKNNEPNAFEREALDVLQAMSAAKTASAVGAADKAVSPMGASKGADLEYWTVKNDRLHYARAMVAQASCLKCHDTPESAPAFLTTSSFFTGGGGFGYVAGQPAGLISVTVPIPGLWETLGGYLSGKSWAALAAIGVALGGMAWELRAARKRGESSGRRRSSGASGRRPVAPSAAPLSGSEAVVSHPPPPAPHSGT